MSLRLGRCLLLVVLCAGVAWLAVPQSGLSQAPKPKVDPAKSVVVKHVTIQGKQPLSKALQTVQGQTGIEIRRGVEEDPTIDLALKNVPFWQALDEIAKAADVRVSLYQRDGKIAMVQGPYREVPTSYSGPFRVTLKKIIAIRDLETGAHGYMGRLEVAWQPPFQPFLLETQPDTFALKDDKGLDQELPALPKSAGSITGERHAIEIGVELPALRRGVPRIGLFKGNLRMIGSAQTLNFTFNELAKAKQEKEGVLVEITNVDAKVSDGESFWTVEVRLKYPPSTFKFESFQISDWLVRNQVQLLKGNNRLGPNGGFDSDPEQTTIRYRWTDDDDRKIKLGKTTAGWKLEYITPGPVLEVPIPFEFKDVPLP